MSRALLFGLVGWLLVTLTFSRADTRGPEEPPAPKASDAVQKILDEAAQSALAKKPEESLKAADRALAVAREIKDSVGEALAHRARALALQDLRRIEPAVAAWREAAAAWERVGDTLGRIEALASAGLLLTAGKPAEAQALFTQAVALGRAEAPRPLATARALQAAGQSSYDRGQFSPAREFWTVALALQEPRAPNSLDLARSLSGLGNVAGQQGDLAAAREYHRRALAIREQQAPNSLDVAGSLNNLGNVAWQQGDLAAAADYYRRALAIIQEQQAPNSLDVAGSLNNLGVVAFQQGDLAAASDYFRRALAIREPQAPNSRAVAASLNNLGLVVYRQGDLAAASDYHRQALAIWEQRAPNSLDMAKSLNNLGLVADQRGDLAAASDYHRRALAIIEKQAPNSLDVATSLNNMGLVAWQQGDLAAASDYSQRALAINEKQAPNSLTMAASLYNLGRVAEKSGDGGAAARLWQQAWDLIRQQAIAVTGDEARQAFDASTAFYAADLIRVQVAQGQVARAFLTWEEGRAQALQQLLLERPVMAHLTDRPQWSAYRAAVAARDRAEQALTRASVAEARAQRDRTARQAEQAAPARLAQAQAALEAATKQVIEAQSAYTRARVQTDERWAEIKRNAPRLFPSPLTLEQAHKALPADTLLIAFSVGKEQTHVFLLRAGREPASSLSTYTVAVTAKELQEQVKQFREQVDRPSRQTVGQMASRALFAQLFPDQARKAIQGAERLLVSPDGPLWDVPFAALVTNPVGSPHYLGQDKAITYTPSLAVFAQARNDPPRLAQGGKVSAVVVGHPIFDRTIPQKAHLRSPGRRVVDLRQTSLTTPPTPRLGERGPFFFDGRPPDPLPDTKTEAVAVAQLYGGELLIEEQATEAALRQRLEHADVIHLATHGYFLPVRAMSSGVLLTVPEKEPDVGETHNDGVLQAWEIYSQLKLRAELVVLSACETGRGQIQRSEGIVGLTRALQYAGARAIVASQWKVADRSTARLMVAFHRLLRQGWAKDEALRQAMARVRRDPRTAHPYYWAAFFLLGDPDNPNLGVGSAR